MKAREAMALWEPGGEVLIVPYPNTTGAGDHLPYSALACYTGYTKASDAEVVLAVFCCALTMIVRDGCDPAIVHREFLKIDEYVARSAM